MVKNDRFRTRPFGLPNSFPELGLTRGQSLDAQVDALGAGAIKVFREQTRLGRSTATVAPH
jgi:hypothetical protein